MAATRLIALHVNKGKTVAQCLADRTDYSQNAAKTNDGEFISSYECDPKTADEEFLLSKRQYQHITGRQQKNNIIAYQIRQSFKPGEITPEEANQVGYETAMRWTKGKHAFIVATHIDKSHIHNHIIYNSTSLDATRKFKNFFLSGLAVQRLSDMVCLEHGLSIIEPSEPLGGPVSRAEWEAARQGKATVRDLIRRDVDEAIRQAYTYQSFLSQLRRMGYRVKTGPRVKHTAILPPGGKGYIRLDSLKDGYTEADIQARLATVRSGEAPSLPNTPPTIFFRLLEPGRRYRVRGGMPRRPRKLTGFQALCFQYLCLLGAYPKRRPGNRAAFSMREELLKLDRYQEQFHYLRKNRIETAAQLSMQYDAIQAEMDALTERRGQLYRQKRRGDGGGEIQAEIEQITTHLRALRRDLKLCARIEGDIPKVRAAVEAQRPDHARRRPYEKTAPRGPERHSGIDTALSAHRGREH